MKEFLEQEREFSFWERERVFGKSRNVDEALQVGGHLVFGEKGVQNEG